MKTIKYNGITYQLDESKFKPAHIKFDQDMFDDEIFPVLVGFGFEVDNLGRTYLDLTNNRNGKKLDFALVYNPTHYKETRTQCHTATEFLNASGIFAVADELPKDWYIEVTEENLEELDAWRKSVATEFLNFSLGIGFYVISKHSDDDSCYVATTSEKIMSESYPNYKKIDLATFRKITGSAPKSVQKIPVTAEIVKSITIPYTVIDQTPTDAELGALVRKIRLS